MALCIVHNYMDIEQHGPLFGWLKLGGGGTNWRSFKQYSKFSTYLLFNSFNYDSLTIEKRNLTLEVN